MSDPTLRLVDTTLRDLGAAPWGAGVAAEDLGEVAAALAPVGAQALEVIDPGSAMAALAGRTESPWDRLRVVARMAPRVPLGISVNGRMLFGGRVLGPDVVRAMVLGACDTGVRRVRAFDPLNHAEALLPVAEAAAEAGAAFVPTLVIGPAPAVGDPRWVEEARALAGLPGATAICLRDEGGHLAPTALGTLVAMVTEACGLPVEVALRAPSGIASMAAMAAVASGASALHAAVGAVALVAGRPSAEALRAALAGAPRELACDRAALEVAGRLVWPLVPAERLRQSASLAGGPALSLPPDLATGLVARLARQGLSAQLRGAADEAAAVCRDLGSVTMSPPVGADVVAQAARHLVEGRRWSETTPLLAAVALGRLGPSRGPVAPDAAAAAAGADPGDEAVLALEEVLAAAPEDLSREDALLLAQFPEPGQRLAARRRSLEAEASEGAPPTLDRGLIETLVEVVEGASQAEVTVEVGGARVTVRRAGPAPGRAPDAGWAPPPEDDGIRVESPMVGTFYRAPNPDADPFVKEGDRVVQGQTLCIIEAMKIFNEIVAERAGTVREVCAENAESVEYGQLLFVLAP